MNYNLLESKGLGSGLSQACYSRCKISDGIVIRCHSCGFVSLFIPDFNKSGSCLLYNRGNPKAAESIL